MDTPVNQSTLKKYIKPTLITLAVIIIIGFLLYLLGISFNLIVFQRLYSYLVTKIVGVTGISQWLVKGIVILVLIPVLWVIPNLFRNKYRKPAIIVGLVYFSIFFLSMFFLSRDVNFAHSDQEVLKWYALTPEGVKLFDSPGVDPVYGIKLKPVTPDVIRKLKLLQKGEFKPIDPGNAQFFNPITGEVQVWFYQYSDGKYEFYDKPGFHPITGEQLKPVTKDIVEKIRSKKISIEDRSATTNTNDSQSTSTEVIKYPMSVNQTWIATFNELRCNKAVFKITSISKDSIMGMLTFYFDNGMSAVTKIKGNFLQDERRLYFEDDNQNSVLDGIISNDGKLYNCLIKKESFGKNVKVIFHLETEGKISNKGNIPQGIVITKSRHFDILSTNNKYIKLKLNRSGEIKVLDYWDRDYTINFSLFPAGAKVMFTSTNKGWAPLVTGVDMHTYGNFLSVKGDEGTTITMTIDVARDNK